MIRGLVLVFITLLFIVSCNNDSISKTTMDAGAKIYRTNCLGCHMEDAMGVPSLNPPLKGSELLLNHKSKSIRIILRGSEELKGEPNKGYKNTMAALGSLTDQEIADVLTFTRNSFGNKAAAVTPDEVKNERAKLN